jgi:hypothetical protein
LLDSTSCVIYVEIIAPDNKHQYHIGAQIHADSIGKATKIEAIVAGDKYSEPWRLNGTRSLNFILKEEKEGGRGVIADAKRDSRKTLKKAADAYFDLLKCGKVSKVRYALGCTIAGDGFMVACTMETPTLTGEDTVVDWRYVIDETVGTVEVLAKLGSTGGKLMTSVLREARSGIFIPLP